MQTRSIVDEDHDHSSASCHQPVTGQGTGLGTIDRDERDRSSIAFSGSASPFEAEEKLSAAIGQLGMDFRFGGFGQPLRIHFDRNLGTCFRKVQGPMPTGAMILNGSLLSGVEAGNTDAEDDEKKAEMDMGDPAGEFPLDFQTIHSG